MFAGLNTEGKLVYLNSKDQAESLIRSGDKFFCPHCQKQLKICCGNQSRPYFKHLIPVKFSLNESKIHALGKELLLKVWFDHGFEVDKEKVIISPNEQRRVDVFVKPNLAVEFQMSPISNHLLRQRNDFYRAQGWRSLWFLGSTYLNEHGFKNNALKFLQYNRRFGFYLIFLIAESKEIQIYHHIRKYDWNQFDWIFEKCPVDQLLDRSLGIINKKFKIVSVAQTKKQLAKLLGYCDQRVIMLQQVCYEHGFDLLHLPDNLFEPKGFSPVISSKLSNNIYDFLNLTVPTLKQDRFPLL